MFALVLDISKAFDKMELISSLTCLLVEKIFPLMIRLSNIYLMNTAAVNWNGALSDDFEKITGVKQGGVLSPLLFSVYINPLIKQLNGNKLGCYMDGLCANTYIYADGIIILSPTCYALRRLIMICEGFSEEFSLSFNLDKSAILLFSDVIFIDDIRLTIFCRKIKIA